MHRNKTFLSMRPDLLTRSCSNEVFNFSPIFAKQTNSLQKLLVLNFIPSTLLWFSLAFAYLNFFLRILVPTTILFDLNFVFFKHLLIIIIITTLYIFNEFFLSSSCIRLCHGLLIFKIGRF